MKKNPDKLNRIIIPKKWNGRSNEAIKQLIEDLQNISPEDMDAIWKEIEENNNAPKIWISDTEREESKINNKNYYTDEKMMYIREFALRFWMELSNREPKMVDNAPVFLCKRWWKYYILLWYDFIGGEIDELFCIDKDLSTIQNVWWKPFIITEKNWKYSIIRWKENIDIDDKLHVLYDKSYNPLFEFANVPIFYIEKNGKKYLNIWLKLYDNQAFDEITHWEIVWDNLIIYGKIGDKKKVLKFRRA